MWKPLLTYPVSFHTRSSILTGLSLRANRSLDNERFMKIIICCLVLSYRFHFFKYVFCFVLFFLVMLSCPVLAVLNCVCVCVCVRMRACVRACVCVRTVLSFLVMSCLLFTCLFLCCHVLISFLFLVSPCLVSLSGIVLSCLVLYLLRYIRFVQLQHILSYF